jgi:hypothetical protein
MNLLKTTEQQVSADNEFFNEIADYGRQIAYIENEELVV